MQRSTVKWFDAKKGYGFINHPEGGDDVFVHYSQILSENDFKTLRTGQQVSFELNDGPKGLHALEVKPLEGESAPEEGSDQLASDASSVPAESTGDSSEKVSVSEDEEEEDEWEWDEEEWTDEHGNPPDPMAGPTF